MDDSRIIINEPVEEGGSLDDKRTRKPYQKPLLEELGDLRAITLGPSPGVGDSLAMRVGPF